MFNVMFGIAAQATLLLVVVVAFALLFRRAPAAARHLVWTLGLIGILLVPAFAALPGWRIPLAVPWAVPAASDIQGAQLTAPPALTAQAPAVPPGGSAHVEAPCPPAVSEPVGTLTPASADESAPSSPAVGSLLTSAEMRVLALWAVGVAVSLLTIMIAWLRLGQLSRRCLPIATGPMHQLMRQLTDELRMRRQIRLVLSSERAIPMTWGIFRPTLLLPAEAAAWTPDRLGMVLLHELGHISRWDCLTHLLGHLARCLYWFHPLAWWSLAQQRREQEKACDDIVLTHGAPADQYAEHLLALTARLPAGYLPPSLALGMARSSRLRDRLASLLDPSRRRSASRGQRAVWTLVALAALVPAAMAKWVEPPREVRAGVVEIAEQDQVPMTPELAKKLEEIRKKLRESYVGPIDDKQLADAAIKGLLQGLKDPYSDYLPADELNALDAQFKGTFFGIGAQLKMIGERIGVATPLENSPALKAGLRPGDIIDAIDGQSTRGEDLGKAVKRILGENGTVVKLKIVREDGAVEDIAVTRGPIRVATVNGFQRHADGSWRHLLDGEHKIGYVRITQFGVATAKEVRAAIEPMLKNDLKGLILDLRSCPGGLLNQSLETCKLFVKDGLLLTIKGPGKQESSHRADGKDTLGDFPMIVLINEQTASAAELCAGVLRDHGRAVPLGTRTFGKGSVQQLVKLEDGGALRVTTSYYYLPSGRMIDKRAGDKGWGIDPDDGFYVPLTKVQSDALQKNQMDRFTLGSSKAGESKVPARLTPKMIEEQYADPQLAAAMRSLVAKTTGGEFLKVGQSTANLQEQMRRLEELRQRREALLQDLKRLEKDIDAAAGKK